MLSYRNTGCLQNHAALKRAQLLQTLILTQNPVHSASTDTCRPANTHLLPRARTSSEPGTGGDAGHPPAGTGGGSPADPPAAEGWLGRPGPHSQRGWDPGARSGALWSRDAPRGCPSAALPPAPGLPRTFPVPCSVGSRAAAGRSHSATATSPPCPAPRRHRGTEGWQRWEDG